MADDCTDLVRLSINGYIDEPSRYMIEWHAVPLRAEVKLGSWECIVRSTDGAIDWYMNGTVTGGSTAEIENEFTSTHFRRDMVLDISLSLSILGTGTSCHLEKQIVVGQET
ncbi:MAG TPA: hypothetical protein VF432_11730 [Thermoanaerobaculia bacterium]